MVFVHDVAVFVIIVSTRNDDSINEQMIEHSRVRVCVCGCERIIIQIRLVVHFFSTRIPLTAVFAVRTEVGRRLSHMVNVYHRSAQNSFLF